MAARKLYEQEDGTISEEARLNLYYVFNNPEELLRPFDRVRHVLESEDITKISLWTGP